MEDKLFQVTEGLALILLTLLKFPANYFLILIIFDYPDKKYWSLHSLSKLIMFSPTFGD